VAANRKRKGAAESTQEGIEYYEEGIMQGCTIFKVVKERWVCVLEEPEALVASSAQFR
jgi:hypothetical protein